MAPVAIGAKHPRLRRLRQLVGRPKARSSERAFVVDGPRLVLDGLRAGLQIEEVFAAPGTLEGSGIEGLLGDDVVIYEVDRSVLAAVLDPVTPQPVAAVAAIPEWSFDELLSDGRPILVAVELRDPGNLGTVIRTAEAAGFAGVIVAGDSVDRFSPKVVRASAGSLFRLPVVGGDDPIDVVAALAATDRLTVAAVVDRAAPAYDQEDLSGAAILIGNEPNGLPPEVIARVDRPITIPMGSNVESLNVGAAASVLCFEAARQRRAGAGTGGNPLDSHRSDAHGGQNASVGHVGVPNDGVQNQRAQNDEPRTSHRAPCLNE